jgi:beta-lactamase superfamily II metal-dependent hydrolase
LNQHHTAVLRTDLDGMVTVRTDGQRLSFDVNRSNYLGLFGWAMAESR